MLVGEEIPDAAVCGRQEHALDPVHFIVEGQARLPHDVQRFTAGVVTLAVANIDQRPFVVEQLGGRDVGFDRRLQVTAGSGRAGVINSP